MSKTIMFKDEVYAEITKDLEKIRKATGETTLTRPTMIQKAIRALKVSLDIN